MTKIKIKKIAELQNLSVLQVMLRAIFKVLVKEPELTL